jgi:hypothetical protein
MQNARQQTLADSRLAGDQDARVEGGDPGDFPADSFHLFTRSKNVFDGHGELPAFLPGRMAKGFVLLRARPEAIGSCMAKRRNPTRSHDDRSSGPRIGVPAAVGFHEKISWIPFLVSLNVFPDPRIDVENTVRGSHGKALVRSISASCLPNELPFMRGEARPDSEFSSRTGAHAPELRRNWTSFQPGRKRFAAHPLA